MGRLTLRDWLMNSPMSWYLVSAMASAFAISLEEALEDKFFDRDSKRDWKSAGSKGNG